VNRPLRHDALLVWRETAAALAGWGDRVLVLIGVALIVTAMRHASQGLAMLPVGIAALVIGGWIGLGLGHVVEERLARHRDAYLFAEDVLTRAGAWRYRLAVFVVAAVAVVGVAVIVDARAVLAAVAGLAGGFVAATANGVPRLRSNVRSVAAKRRRGWVGAVLVVAMATLPLWWAAAPAWIAAVPVLVVAMLTAPDDAEAARFEAIIGRRAGETVAALRSMIGWCIAVVLAATVGQGLAGGAIGAATAGIVVWFGALRLLAWRWVGRRSGELIVLAAVAGSAVIGAMAVVLAPIALAVATIWLWRRSQAATWLIA
jgi:hypothetical protein